MSNITASKTLSYFRALIDEHGIIQFTDVYKKDYVYGYAIEDQARALILALHLGDFAQAKQLFGVLLNFKKAGVLHMLYDSKRQLWHTPKHSEEAGGQYIWALCQYYTRFSDEEILSTVEEIYQLTKIDQYPRACSYALLGLCLLHDLTRIHTLARALVRRYEETCADSWDWFEDTLYYANALLPWALLCAYEKTSHHKYLDIAKKSLRFLLKQTQIDGVPVAIGNHFWYFRGGKKAMYDQQPIDPAYTVIAAAKMYQISKEQFFADEARRYFSWFTGNNVQKVSMIRGDGGIFDGLTPHGPNRNAGAESTICFLLARHYLGLLV